MLDRVLAAAGVLGALAACSPSGQATAAGPDMNPPRLLSCVLARATNLDPSKPQAAQDITFEGRHDFALFLPAASKRKGPPPDPTDAPEPVDPATHISADPDGLARDASPVFQRVVDLWPERVEMIAPIDDKTLRLIIIHDIDPATGKASLYMTRAFDAASMDLQQVYQGSCTISNRRPA